MATIIKTLKKSKATWTGRAVWASSPATCLHPYETPANQQLPANALPF